MIGKALRERVAFLKVYKGKVESMKFDRRERVSKASDWTDDEIQVLRETII